MENKVLSKQEELLQLKASAYDVSREVNRYNGILQQINARIEQLQKEIKEETVEEEVQKQVKTKNK